MRIIISHDLVHTTEAQLRAIAHAFDVQPDLSADLASFTHDSRHLSITQHTDVLNVTEIWIDDAAVVRVLVMYTKLARILGSVILALKRSMTEVNDAIEECQAWFGQP